MDLREGESRPAIEAFVALFGIIAGHTILETARDALFLSKLPASRLSLVYALVALLTLGVSALNSAFVRRFGQKTALMFTLIFAAYGTTVLHFLKLTTATLFVLYAWSALMGTVLGVQFWMFAGQRFTVAQGKRLFGPIAAGGVGGAVTGAGAAAAALAVIPVGSLLLVSAGLFLSTAVFLTTVQTEEADAEPDLHSPRESRDSFAPAPRLSAPPDPPPAESLFALFRRYPYLRQMALLAAISTAALLVTDYLFKSVAAQRVPAAELGAFFARTYAVLNAVSLVVQLLLTGRVLRQLGVVPALLILPLLITGGGAGVFLTAGALTMALLTKGADGSLRYSLHRVASELLWMPLPGAVRDRSKALVDSVFKQGMQAAMGGVLLLLVMGHLGKPRILGGLVAVLAVGWLATTVVLRRSYLDLFRKALSRGQIELSAGADELDVESIEAVMEALSSRDAVRVRVAMSLLHEKNRSRLIPGLILYHESEEVLLHALQIAGDARRREWTPLTVRLLSHASEAVRVAAVRALGNLGEIEAIRPALADVSPVVRGRAAFDVAHADPTVNPYDEPTIREVLALPGEAGRVVSIALLDAVCDRSDHRWADVVLGMLHDRRHGVAEHAAQAMAHLRDERFIAPLIARLGTRDGRAAVREALVHQGEPALEALIRALADLTTPPRVRVHLPRTISRFGNQRAADVLLDVLEKDRQGFVRYKALRGLGRMVAGDGGRVPRIRLDVVRVEAELQKNLIEHLRLSSVAAPILGRVGVVLSARAAETGEIILALLADKQRQSLERAFRLLQILHRREDIRQAYLALLSGDKRLRAQSLEFLDTLLGGRRGRRPAEHRELLRLVADDLPAPERVARSRPFLRRPPETYEEALVVLLADRDDTLATFAAYHALDLESELLRAEVDRALVARPYLNVATPLAAPAARSGRLGAVSRRQVAAEVSHGE